MTDRTHPDSGRATGAAHIIRYALELGLLWIDGDGRDKVREALDALDTLEAQLEAIGAGGVSGPLMGQPQAMPDLSALTERGAKAWTAVDAQGLREGFTAADMATAEARGFRDGAASAMAGEPMAWMTFTEEGDPDMVFLDRLEACQYCEDDDPPKPLYLAAPPTAQAGGWISVEDARKPQPGKPVVFWVWAERYQEDDEGRQIAQDASGLHLGEWRESENGNYFDNYSTPFADREAVLWWMDPTPPTAAEGVEHG